MNKDEFNAALSNPALDIFTAVRMARADALAGNFVHCIARLRQDADKLRAIDASIYQVVCAAQMPGWVKN